MTRLGIPLLTMLLALGPLTSALCLEECSARDAAPRAAAPEACEHGAPAPEEQLVGATDCAWTAPSAPLQYRDAVGSAAESRECSIAQPGRGAIQCKLVPSAHPSRAQTRSVLRI